MTRRVLGVPSLSQDRSPRFHNHQSHRRAATMAGAVRPSLPRSLEVATGVPWPSADAVRDDDGWLTRGRGAFPHALWRVPWLDEYFLSTPARAQTACAVGVAAALRAALARWPAHAQFVTPGAFLGAIVAFHLVAAGSGSSLHELREARGSIE